MPPVIARCRLADGNTTDDQTHIATWEELRVLTGRADFLYVADCKLCTHEQMTHIDRLGGRFVTVLPRSRKEDGFLRDWAQTNQPEWAEAERREGKRKHDPDEVWQTAPAPIPSAEGYRIIWVRSSQKVIRDAEARQQRIERGLRALAALADRLQSPKSRLRTLPTVEEAAKAALARAGTEHWINWKATATIEDHYRQERRGRPGKDTRYRKHTKTRFDLEFAVDADTVAYDAATDGCFPLITNDRQPADPEILAAYRYQPNLEKRHHQLKCRPGRRARVPQEPRADRGPVPLPLHRAALLRPDRTRATPGDGPRAGRAAAALSRAARLQAAQRRAHARTLHQPHPPPAHPRRPAHQPIQTFQPELTPLHTQLLDLLGVPAAAYMSTR